MPIDFKSRPKKKIYFFFLVRYVSYSYLTGSADEKAGEVSPHADRSPRPHRITLPGTTLSIFCQYITVLQYCTAVLYCVLQYCSGKSLPHGILIWAQFCWKKTKKNYQHSQLITQIPLTFNINAQKYIKNIDWVRSRATKVTQLGSRTI